MLIVQLLYEFECFVDNLHPTDRHKSAWSRCVIDMFGCGYIIFKLLYFIICTENIWYHIPYLFLLFLSVTHIFTTKWRVYSNLKVGKWVIFRIHDANCIYSIQKIQWEFCPFIIAFCHIPKLFSRTWAIFLSRKIFITLHQWSIISWLAWALTQQLFY